MRKTTTLQVQHAFLDTLPSFHDYNVHVGELGHRTTTSFFFFWTYTCTQFFRIQLQENGYIWPRQMELGGIRAMNFENAQIHFFGDVFAAVAYRCCCSSFLDRELEQQQRTVSATKTSHKNWICSVLNFIAHIPSRLIRPMLANVFGVEF